MCSKTQAPIHSTPSLQDQSISGLVLIKHHSTQYVFSLAQVQIPKDLRDLQTPRKCVVGWNSMILAIPEQKPKLQQAKNSKGLNAIPILLSVSSTLFYPQSVQAGDLNHLVIVILFHIISTALPKREEENSESSKCFNRSPSSTRHSSHTSHFSFGSFNTPVRSVLFISFYR